MKKKLLCAVMCCVLICGTFAPKRAYAVAGVDDAAVGIVCALLAAAGVTFASNDGVQDAVGDFLEESGGAYDVVLRSLVATAVPSGDVLAYKVDPSILPGVRGLLEGLFDFFKTDENRQGAAVIPGGSFNWIDVSSLSPISFGGKVWEGCRFVPCSPDTIAASYDKFGKLIYFVDNFRFDSGDSTFVCDEFYAGNNSKEKILLSRSASSFSDIFLQVDYSNAIARPSKGFLAYGFTLSDNSTGGIILPNDIVLINDDIYYHSGWIGVDISTWVPPGIDVADKSIPYGLTFPEELTAPDVIDNFEQRVEAAAGDLAIVVPVDGVIDNTLPYAEAQEQYLANVNELGEITDTVTETNSWLSKILTAVKSIPAKVIGTGTLDFSGFQNIGLSSVFPFCIPFDLKNALVGFNVTPADPIWEISFDGTFMSAAGSFVLDMTKFEKLFAIVRFFIYGGFVVSLILLTRKIIKG